jgi:hypothetical protein
MSKPGARTVGAEIQVAALSAADIRRLIDSSESEVTRLAGKAMNPRTRAVITCAKTDLRFAAEHLQQHSTAIDLENLGVWLELIERRLPGVAAAIEQFGPGALPSTVD